MSKKPDDDDEREPRKKTKVRPCHYCGGASTTTVPLRSGKRVDVCQACAAANIVVSR